jgi:hypothetical protein
MRRFFTRLFRDPCRCEAARRMATNDTNRQCVRCQLLWDAKKAFPTNFTTAAEIYTLSISGRDDQ